MPLVGMRRTTRVFGVVKAADGARVSRSGHRICPMDKTTVDKMFGNVYSRKRKRLSEPLTVRSEEPLRSLKFYCRRRRRLSHRVSSEICPVLTVTVDWLCEDCWFLTVFGLVMRYTRREKLGLSSLTSFFLSQPINQVFADHGVRFLVEQPRSSKGVCKFFGAVNCLPLFSADYSVIPQWFMDMHFTLFLKVAPRSFFFVEKSLYLLNNPVEESDSESEVALPKTCNSSNGDVVGLMPSVRALKLNGGNAQYRGNLGSHGFQKRRSSLRRRRRKNLSHNAAVSTRKLSRSVLGNSSPGSNGISVMPMTRTKEELDSLCCSVNILTIYSDRCTREEGFSVMLEASSSKEWFLVIKKDGVIRYSHKAQKTMRTCSSNRVTHAIVWMGDDNWKLEFCDRQVWLGFKEIYKECYERNVMEQNLKVLPIPGVREVCGYAEDVDNFSSFSRPVTYITMNEDEISRAMARSIALYDMDSEDEEWLEKQNRELLGKEDDQFQELERETFELMIDGFEKFHFHNSADDLLDGKAAAIDSLSHLGRQEVVEAVHEYWLKKRKQRKAPLLRIFQGHQVKKTRLFSKPMFRKRRSFKRLGSQLHGKAKQTSPWLGSVNEAEAEEENEYIRMAETAMKTAIAKRRRAQVLGENADLAVYKAMMTLRIAKAIKVAKSSEVDNNKNRVLQLKHGEEDGK